MGRSALGAADQENKAGEYLPESSEDAGEGEGGGRMTFSPTPDVVPRWLVEGTDTLLELDPLE